MLAGGLFAAFSLLFAPEWLNSEIIGLALVLGAMFLGAVAVDLVILKVVAGGRDEVRQWPWSSVALVSVGAGLLVWVSAVGGGDAGRAAALMAPVLGLLFAVVSLWSLRRRNRSAAV